MSPTAREHRQRPAIIDEGVEPAEAPFDFGNRAPATALASETSQCTPSVFPAAASASTVPQQLALDVEQRHAPALGEKPFCDGKPDAARGTVYQAIFLRGGVWAGPFA